MSKSALTLWQRIKQLLANTPTTDATSLPSADSSQMNQTTSARPTSYPINAAFSEPLTQPAKTLAHTGDTKDKLSALTADEVDGDALLPIAAQDIEDLLQIMGYHFVYHPAREEDAQNIHHFTMQVSDKSHEWGCMLRYFGEQQLMAVYSILPFSVPENHRAEMLAVLSYLNYDLMIGNLEMDLADGELRFKTSIDLEVTGLNELVLSYLLQSNFSLISRLYETLEEVVKRKQPAQDIPQAIQTLIASQQAKEFFVMSEVVQ